MKLYIASGAAQNAIGFSHRALALNAETETEANDKALAALLSVKPLAHGWHSHTVIVTEVPTFTLRGWAEACLITHT
jgi:hypothetical protein